MKTILTSICVFCITLIFAGNPDDAKKKFEKAEQYLESESYALALPIYLDILKTDPENANIAFKAGICYLNSSSEKNKAEAVLEKAAEKISEKYAEGSFKERNAPSFALFYLGKAQHFNYNFDKAISSFEKFLTLVGESDPETTADVKRNIEMCRNGIELKQNPVNIKVENVGINVNSPYSEHSPLITADESMLIFTSRRKESTGGMLDPKDNTYFEDIYLSTRSEQGWNPPVNIGVPINTEGHDATIGLSVDGQSLLVYKDDNGDGNIYQSNLVGNMWLQPRKLNDYVNSKSWESGASISADNNFLFFTSDRAGGFGGRDIYRSRKLPNGEWGRPINLGPAINTQYDEEAPFLHPDGKTLYFSSLGHKCMGGFDIFTSVLTDSGTWTMPENIGYPVNTTDDDVFYIPTPDNRRAYYSSFKNEGGVGEKDIYMLTYPDVSETPLTVYRGVINSVYGGVPEGAMITVTDNETGELIGTYTPNIETGKYLIILQPGKNYNISYEAEGFLFQSENLDVSDSSAYKLINKAVELSPIKVGTKITLKNIFFKSGQSTLTQESKVELEKLRDLMKKLPKVVAEISGHTDSQGSEDLNQRLSQKRAEAVLNYLVSEGIEPSRLKAIGYGETRPIAKNQNDDGSPNKAGMAMNRRFEFTILSTTGVVEDAVEKIKVPEELKPKDDK